MNHIKSVITTVAAAAGLSLSFSAQAQIRYYNAPSPIEYASGAANTAQAISNASYTVSSGASLLIFMYGGRTQGASPAPGSDPGTPASVTWNVGANQYTMTRAITQGSTASTWDDNSIYYLYNPPAGTGTFTCTTPADEAQTWWTAYTLQYTAVSGTPQTGGTGSGSAQTINNTVSSVPANDWAAVNTSTSGNAAGETLILTTSPTGPTVATLSLVSANATQTMGGVSGTAAGNLEFISTGSTGTDKMVLCEALFAYLAPAVPTAPAVTTTTGNPVEVNLSWTPAANVSSYVVARSTNNGGPYTTLATLTTPLATAGYSDPNVISGTTYYYVVVAVNPTGSTPSAQQIATPVGSPFPVVLGVGAAGAGNINLHWLPTFGATSYTILRGTGSGGETLLMSGVTGTTYPDTGLTPGTTYYYEVEAAGLGGTSPVSNEASAVALGSGWYLFDNFGLDTVNVPLNGQTGSAGLGLGWTNVSGGTPINVVNAASGQFGANYGQYTVASTAGTGDLEAGLAIPGTATASTVFLEFSLPGIQSVAGTNTGTAAVAMNFEIDNANPPTSLTGAEATGPSAQFNYDSTSSDGYFRVYGSNVTYYATISPTATPYLPIPGNLYYFWFVINPAQGSYQVYLADGSVTGTNLDINGLGASPTLMWGTTTLTGEGNVNTFLFRNLSAGGTIGQPVNYIATGPGSTLGTVAQNEFANIFVDQHAQNLTNPVTGLGPFGAPQIFVQPQPLQLFAGETAIFNIEASSGVTFQWQSNNVNVGNGLNISGATTASLTISNVSPAIAFNYTCLVENPVNSSILDSSPASLTIVTPSGSYETDAVAAAPLHYYAFNDTATTGGGTAIAFDWAGSDNGIYGANVENGSVPIYGPTPTAGFPGFSANNYGAQFAGEDEPNNVTVDFPWNLNTNVVTMTAWVYPFTSTEPSSTAIVMNRGTGNDVEGFTYNSVGDYNIGYTWNNDPNTSGWDSFLQPPANEWSFLALTVTSTNAVITMMNANGISTATHNYPHPVTAFAGTPVIGDDPGGSAVGARTFVGIIDELGIYNTAVSAASMQSMYFDGSGTTASQYSAGNTLTPSSLSLYPGQTAVYSAVVQGSLPITNVWQINAVNLSDGPNAIGTISGSATESLTITNLAAGDAGQTYNVTLMTSDANGSFVTASASFLTVLTPNTAETITTLNAGTAAGFEAQGDDWNTGATWSDSNPADVSVYAEPGSTYEIVPGTMERSPVSTNAVFPSFGSPANALIVQGDGVLLDGNGANFDTETTTGELRLKESGAVPAVNYGTAYAMGGSVTFPNLILDGGQVDNGVSAVIDINGNIDVTANSSIYVDSAAAGSIRSYVINALLSGSGTLTYAFLGTSNFYSNNDIVIANPNNTFNGQWNIEEGTLLGNALNSLGTNSITIGANASLETTYNIDDPNATLILNGQVNLYTEDTFFALVVTNYNVPPGTYTFAQIHTMFPSNFPPVWTVQLGSTTGTNTGPGSITVLSESAPYFTLQPVSVSIYPGQSAQFSATSPNATSYQWWFTNSANVAIELSDGLFEGSTSNAISGSQSNLLTITNATAANAGTYVLVAKNLGSSTPSSAATLTIMPASSPETITTTTFEGIGSDWNTASSWIDGLAASVSVYAAPGSTYQVVSGSMERSPVATNAVFPGETLQVLGNGVLVDGNELGFDTETTTGELRLKESGGTGAVNYGTPYVIGGSVTFPDLQLLGGQIDNGNGTSVVIDGEIDVLANSSIYADSASGNEVRSMQINALLTGSGSLTYSFLGTATPPGDTNNDLDIANGANTFSGQWIIGPGGLLGSATGALGTNSITVEANGILETTYNLNSPNATLTMNGQMYLYTADKFNSVSINGTTLYAGTYTFAQLNSAFPTVFPATWQVQLGSTTGTNAGSVGSITVVSPPLPGTIRVAPPTAPSGGNITLSGSGGPASGFYPNTYHVLTSTNLALALHDWTVLTSGTFNADGTYTTTVATGPGDQQQYFIIKMP